MNTSRIVNTSCAVVVIGFLAAPVSGQMPCTGNYQCTWNEFCDLPAGQCSGQGVCAPRPEICLAYVDPVCGCNGITYSNGCYAAMAGVNVAYFGECSSPCVDNTGCSVGKYCQKDTGECDSIGHCQSRPTSCSGVSNPVCGCDGVTYLNAGCAAVAGVNVACAGECIIPCTSSASCPGGQFCEKPAGQCAADGICRSIPAECPPYSELVCGCDGVTYPNADCAAMAGASVAYQGECTDSCTSNATCPVGEYCRRILSDCDGLGTCEPIPTNCPGTWDPVCGCDGTTYDNSCMAAMAGTTLLYTDTCIFVPSDFDHDGDVDQQDFGMMQRCLSGAEMTQQDPICVMARLDLDPDVDNDDMRRFLDCLSGPMVRPDPACGSPNP